MNISVEEAIIYFLIWNLCPEPAGESDPRRGHHSPGKSHLKIREISLLYYSSLSPSHIQYE